ncbi:MAG TPA: hypothetical protein VGU44_02085 [Gammaproteobacteria bacterium]|nr:hypothetical protein [Gammaproteobacteria bacterium]
MSATAQDLEPVVAKEENKEAQEKRLQTALTKYRKYTEEEANIVAALRQMQQIKDNGISLVNECTILKEIIEQQSPNKAEAKPKTKMQLELEKHLLPTSDSRYDYMSLKGLTLAVLDLGFSTSDPLSKHLMKFYDFIEQNDLKMLENGVSPVPLSLLPLLEAHVTELEQGYAQRQRQLAELNNGIVSTLRPIEQSITLSFQQIFDTIISASNQNNQREQKTDGDSVSQLRTLKAHIDRLKSSLQKAKAFHQDINKVLQEKYTAVVTESVKNARAAGSLIDPAASSLIDCLNAFKTTFERLDTALSGYQSALDTSQHNSRLECVLALAQGETTEETTKLANMLLPMLSAQVKGLDSSLSKLKRFATLYNTVKPNLEPRLKALSQQISTTGSMQHNLGTQLGNVQTELQALSWLKPEAKTEPPAGPVLTPAANTGTTTTAAIAPEQLSGKTSKQKKKR